MAPVFDNMYKAYQVPYQKNQNVIEALNAIDEVTKQTIIDARCEDKRQFIQDFVSKQIGMRRNAA